MSLGPSLRMICSMTSSGVMPSAATLAAISAVFLFGAPLFFPAPGRAPPLIPYDIFSLMIDLRGSRGLALHSGYMSLPAPIETLEGKVSALVRLRPRPLLAARAAQA